ncbi:MAG: chloride channel protein [Firmicutes bacterium]|nr:chloride channel protein [Bacillota bacterium]
MSVLVSVKQSDDRVYTTERLAMLILSVLIGVIGGFLAVGYFYLVKLIRWLFTDQKLHVAALDHRYYIVLIPVIGGFFIGLLNYFFTSDARSTYGVPGVIEAIGLRGGRIRNRIVAARALAAAICIGAGGAAGKQGSIVQMGLEVGFTLGRWLRLSEHNIKLLVNCGVAALIGANYNTPLGGAIFVFEVIMGEFNLAYFSLVVTSSATAALIYRSFLGNLPKFTAPSYYFKSPDELLWYVLLGALCGILGIIYVKVVFISEEVFKGIRSRLPGMWQLSIPVLGGLALGLISFFVPLSFGRGTKGIDMVLSGQQLLPHLMILLILLKLLSISITMGAWSTGGGYRAGLFTGAMLGCTMGVVFHHLAPVFTSPPATYALVGMAGVFGGFAQAPLTGIVMMSEMTKDYHLFIPLTITSVVAAYTSRSVATETLYTGKLIRRGLDVFNARRADILKGLLVRNAMVTSMDVLSGSMTLKEAYRTVISTAYKSFPVLGKNEELIGVINQDQIKQAIKDGNTHYRLDELSLNQVFIYTWDTLREAARKIDLHRVNLLPVVDEKNPGRIVGILTRSDIIRAYNRDLEQVARQPKTLLSKKYKHFQTGGDITVTDLENRLRYHDQPYTMEPEAVLLENPYAASPAIRLPLISDSLSSELAMAADKPRMSSTLAARSGAYRRLTAAMGKILQWMRENLVLDLETSTNMAATEISLRYLREENVRGRL